ncbi:fatty acid desaturase [bacterium]|nr:fatty acid desaturase [bacterium]
MSEGAVNPDSLDMGTAALPGRAALDIAVVRELSQRSDLRGLVRFGSHVLVMLLTGTCVWLAQPNWYLLVPAMILHGFTIVTMFAPMHECVHRTAFATRAVNEVFGWIAGVLSFYNFTYYRHYHTWHHRYTQIPDKDPELMTPKPRSFLSYLIEISGVLFWFFRPLHFVQLALGMARRYPFVPERARWNIAASAACQLAIYVAGVTSIFMGYPWALYYWFLPALLAQPLLRAILIVEHTGCTNDENGLTNTRTTLAMFPVRLLMWNMPFHTEHHLYPSIPFHELPRAHQKLKEKLVHLAPSYVAANREVIGSLHTTADTNS